MPMQVPDQSMDLSAIGVKLWIPLNCCMAHHAIFRGDIFVRRCKGLKKTDCKIIPIGYHKHNLIYCNTIDEQPGEG